MKAAMLKKIGMDKKKENDGKLIEDENDKK
jgi:hypothetical protein